MCDAMGQACDAVASRPRHSYAPYLGAASWRSTLAALGLMLTLTACYSDQADRQSGTTAAAPPTLTYPNGVVTTGDAQSKLRGIFPTAGADAGSCCWLGPEADFRVMAPAGARVLTLTTYEPVIPKLSDAQSVSLLDAAGHVVSARRVAPGKQTVNLPLSKKSVTNGAVSVRLRMGSSIVPKDAGLNGDPRRLSVMLISVSAK